MVIHRKEKQSFIAKNLEFLRKNTGNTLEEMAQLLLIKKASYYAYEKERALPDIHKLMKLANYFDVSLEELVYKNLASANYQETDAEIIFYEIEKVPIAARAGYARGYSDDSVIRELPKIKIPYKPYGIARAFEIEGDSMEPDIKDGSTVIGIKIGRGELKDKGTYIVVTDEGLQCKDVRVSGNTVYLISKNINYLPTHIEGDNLRELWEVWKKDIK